jgi:hypothetical protein
VGFLHPTDEATCPQFKWGTTAVGREPLQKKAWLIALLLRDWQFRKSRCHDFDHSPLIIQTDGDAFSYR